MIIRKAIAIAAFAVSAFAGTIAGIATDAMSGKPLRDVMVQVEHTSALDESDSLGRYSFDSVPPGTYNLIFAHADYESFLRTDVYVSGSGAVRIDVALERRLDRLATVRVSAKSFSRPPDMSVSSKIMTGDEIIRAPGALADVQRAVQNLPSVASGGDNVNEIVVRGGSPGENLLLVDNIEVPNLSHFGEQGTGGGVVSLLNPILVKGLTFCAGAPPAQYGGKASSVLDVILRDGNTKMVVGGIDIGMAGAGGHVEGPLWNGANFMLSGMKSYLDFISRFDDQVAVPGYWGAQARIAQQAGIHRIVVNALGGSDEITIGNAAKDIGSIGQTVTAGGLIYATGATATSFWTDRFSTKITLSGVGNSFDRREFTDSLAIRTMWFSNRSFEQQQAVTASGTFTNENGLGLTIGGRLVRSDATIDIDQRPDTLSIYDTTSKVFAEYDTSSGGLRISVDKRKQELVDFAGGGFVSAIIPALGLMRIVPGLRVDADGKRGAALVSPRISAVFSTAPGLDLTAAFGVQYQDPDFADRVLTPTLAPRRALTTVVGCEYTLLPADIQFILEGYFKIYDHLPVDSSLITADPFDRSAGKAAIGDGRGSGVELFVQKKLTDHIFGTFAWAIARSRQKDPRPGMGGDWYPADFDFPQTISLTGGYKTGLLQFPWYQSLHEHLWFCLLSPIMPIADRLELSFKFRYLAGRPRATPQYDALHGRWCVNDALPLNHDRFPDYSRFDIRFERRFGFGFLNMIYYFDLQNIGGRKNIWTYIYSDRNIEPTPIYQFPFFPAGGVIIGF